MLKIGTTEAGSTSKNPARDHEDDRGLGARDAAAAAKAEGAGAGRCGFYSAVGWNVSTTPVNA